MADPKSPSVFLSYSHDSAEHADRVLALADALRDRGIDVILDRYLQPHGHVYSRDITRDSIYAVDVPIFLNFQRF